MNILKTKVNSLEKEYPDVTSLIDINQCITDKQNLEKKNGDVDQKNTRHEWFNDCDCFE